MKLESSQQNGQLAEQRAEIKSGYEKFFGQSSYLNIDVLDFWKWSSSNLLINTNRGVLAEFLVASSLNLIKEPRFVWGNYDLIMTSEVTIEVKSASIYQAWKQSKASRISFTISKKYEWNYKTGEWSNEPARSADIYVFCVLYGTEPLNLGNWKFYVLLTECINEIYGDQKTVSIKSLNDQFPELEEFRFDRLSCAIKDAEKDVLLRRENR